MEDGRLPVNPYEAFIKLVSSSSSSPCKNETKAKGKELRLTEMEKLDLIQVLH